LTPDDYVDGVLAGDRAMLARTITLIESVQKDIDPKAREVLSRLLPHTGQAQRVGITGVPGVGKSTLIETLGTQLIEDGHRVAVLAVDPSSSVSGGSILGDKSRMPTLSNNPEAFIRPSPNALTPGGVGRRTREIQLLCEAAGYDIVLVETVGVGQSEIMVAEMVDTFVALMLPGAGDELQGIKKGVLELADVIVVNKADGDTRARAHSAKREYDAALRYLRHRTANWKPQVQLISALTGAGIRELWQQIERHFQFLKESGELEERRKWQRQRWMWSLIEERLVETFREHPDVRSRLPAVEKGVLEGKVPATQAVQDLLEAYSKRREESSRDEH
jgi:LAO/AO transport system kinase